MGFIKNIIMGFIKKMLSAKEGVSSKRFNGNTKRTILHTAGFLW